MTYKQRKRARELLAAATPRPWHEYIAGSSSDCPGRAVAGPPGYYEVASGVGEEDCALIIEAPVLLEAALDEIEVLRSDVLRLEAALDEINALTK